MKSGSLVLLVFFVACADESLGVRPVWSELNTHDEESCIEPKEPEEVPREVRERGPAPSAPPVRGALGRDGRTHFDLGASRTTVRVYEHLLDPDEEARQVSHEVGGHRITVVAPGVRPPRPGRNESVISLRRGTLHDHRIAMDVAVFPDAEKLYFRSIWVEHSDGRAAGHASASGFASEPATCGELALIRFGSIPSGMPSFTWPINKSCSGNRCTEVRHAYVEALHGTWRMTQMMDGIASMPSYSRSWAWDQPAANAGGESAGERTSLRYYFGSYDSDRFATIRELYNDHLNVLRTARMDGIKLRLKCPNSSDHPGNACFSGSSWAHHVVKGWVNICPKMWDRLGSGAYSDEDQVMWRNHTVAHELFHHHWVRVGRLRWRFLKDTISHRHGNACLRISTEQMIVQPGSVPPDVRVHHLASWVNDQDESCGHRRAVLRNLDNYNAPARVMGERIRDGSVIWWPLVEPTPQPPTCVGGENCLCEEVDPAHDAPDGDHSVNQHCSDNGATLECMRREVNAGAIVGICTDCDVLRGPGCECRDGIMPCQVGSCFGDDTRGQDSGYGQCFIEPPDYACLADCQRLIGENAYCLWDNPDRGRCLPAGVGRPFAIDCWQYQNGHVDFEGDCVTTPECGPGAWPTAISCQDLGYPPYFQCDGNRCVADI